MIDEALRKNILEPVFWGFIVALICLPFYLAMVVPQIAQSFDIGGQSVDIGAIHAFLMPMLMAFLGASLMGGREMKSALIMMISASLFLTFLMIFILVLPQLTGAVYFVGTYYIEIAKKMIMSFMMFFPSLLIGSVIGKIFGEVFVSDISREERKKLNAEMREWKETLEKAIQDSERGGGSDKSPSDDDVEAESAGIQGPAEGEEEKD